MDSIMHKQGEGLAGGLFLVSGYPAWFIADLCGALGGSLQPLAVSLLAYEIGGSVEYAGCVATLYTVAMGLCTLIGGVVVDRCRREILLVMYGAMQTLLWLVAAVVSSRYSFSIYGFGTLAILAAVLQGALGGTSDALLRSLVGDEKYYVARSANEARDAVMLMVGSSLTGILCSMGITAFSLLKAGLHAMGLLASISLLRKHGTQGAGIGDRGSEIPYARSLVEGFCLLRSRQFVSLVLSAGWFNLAYTLLQYIAQFRLMLQGVDMAIIGFLDSFLCIGLLLGAVSAMRLRSVGIYRICRVTMVVMGLAAVIIVQDLPIVVMACALCLVSCLMPPTSASIAAKLYLSVGDDQQGRARAISVLSSSGMSSIAPWLASQLSSVGGVFPFGFGAFVMLVAIPTVILSAGRSDVFWRRKNRAD